MKKVLSILLIVVMMLSFFILPASASENAPVTEYKYYEKTKEYLVKYTPVGYKEWCYYSDETQEEPDWVLIKCQIMPEPWNKKYGALVGNRVLWTRAGSGINVFSTGFAVYIPETDTFIELDNGHVEQIIGQCPNFVQAIEENEIGQKLGDINENGVVDVIDATYIQRYVAGYMDPLFNYETYVYLEIEVWSGSSGDFYISDYDKDGKTTVLDATAIQRHIAGLE